MKEKGIRELQVSSSHLVIVFLSILILGLIVFLLGVSVGKKQTEIVFQTANASAAAKLRETDPATNPLPVEILKEQTVQPPAKEETVIPQQDRTQNVPKVEDKSVLKSQEAAPVEKSTLSESKTKTKSAAGKTTTKSVTAKSQEPSASTTDKTAAKPASAKTPSSGLYYIQVGAFNVKSQAQEMADQFKKYGFNALVLDTFPTDKNPTFRIRIGGYSTKDEAEKVKTTLKPQPKKKGNYFVVKD